MKKIFLGLLLASCFSGCASVDSNEVAEAKGPVERRYTTGSMIPQKREVRSTNDVKTVNSDDLITMPRAATPNDPLGKK